MYGSNGFMGKVMGLFMDCDKMCGPEFEKGLANLGAVASESASANIATITNARSIP